MRSNRLALPSAPSSNSITISSPLVETLPMEWPDSWSCWEYNKQPVKHSPHKSRTALRQEVPTCLLVAWFFMIMRRPRTRLQCAATGGAVSVSGASGLTREKSCSTLRLRSELNATPRTRRKHSFRSIRYAHRRLVIGWFTQSHRLRRYFGVQV